MGDWPNLDVTPVGREPGTGPHATPTASASSHDPFGSRPSRRRRGWVRIALGAAALLGGIVATALGILEAVDERGRIESEAVARGVVTDGRSDPVTFTVPQGERRDYTVYLLFEGRVSREPQQELTVRDTGCTASLPGGGEESFRGARQGVASSIGQASSVGHFTAPPGEVELLCAYTSSTLRSRRLRPDSVRYVVTPGAPSVASGGVLLIVGGVALAIAGGFMVGWGWRGSRRPL